MRTPALALALSLALAGPAPAQTFGLDLDTPKSATAAFAEAWAAGDYGLAWMALDPELRFRFNAALNRLDLAAVLPGADDADAAGALFDAVPEHVREHTRDGSASMLLVDLFAYFDGVMRAADAAGMPPFTLEGTLPEPGPADTQYLLPGTGETLLLHLRRSPGGHWRIVGIASDSRALPAMWAPDPD